ncbi:hypothetical protein [Leptospira neocaledonica]|uniref:Lipoprotein n=1 Tax=Leptospira neocaledonica TaxID=2023192 RepID=A0A2N0A073_9LEPT|nr:hypothetical protein [Leptospira neocaledonica]PJZ77712.1 hypothetical protein CH365_09155 [Leptospira neocaledonica]
MHLKKLKFLFLIFVIGLNCKASQNNPENFNSIEESKQKQVEGVVNYGFSPSKRYLGLVRNFLGLKEFAKDAIINDFCLELDKVQNRIRFGFIDSGEEEVISMKIERISDDIFKITSKKNTAFIRKYRKNGDEGLYLSFDLESIESDAKERKAETEKKYGVTYVQGPLLVDFSFERCIGDLFAQTQFQKGEETFSKEVQKHGAWGDKGGK